MWSQTVGGDVKYESACWGFVSKWRSLLCNGFMWISIYTSHGRPHEIQRKGGKELNPYQRGRHPSTCVTKPVQMGHTLGKSGSWCSVVVFSVWGSEGVGVGVVVWDFKIPKPSKSLSPRAGDLLWGDLDNSRSWLMGYLILVPTDELSSKQVGTYHRALQPDNGYRRASVRGNLGLVASHHYEEREC